MLSVRKNRKGLSAVNEQKKNRVAAALTVNAIILIFILAAVAIYTLVEVSVKAREKRELQAEIARYEQLIKDGEKTLEDLQSDEHLLYLALKYGYVFQSGTAN